MFLYQTYDNWRSGLLPIAQASEAIGRYAESVNSEWVRASGGGAIQAAGGLLHEFSREYEKPSFGIEGYTEERISLGPFCDLLHFIPNDNNGNENNNKVYNANAINPSKAKYINSKNVKSIHQQSSKKSRSEQKPLIIFAPLSGHYATLLRDTVQRSLSDHPVFITDWKNVRDIPMLAGKLDFDGYVDIILNAMKIVHDRYGVWQGIAVCQPTVPVLAACVLAHAGAAPGPEALVLMGGPVDTRINPTEVNLYAKKHNIDWFRKNVIHFVPVKYSGAGRMVYPGFLQHLGFVAMNFYKHKQAHVDFFNHLMRGADVEAHKHRVFYDEYNAVMDLDAAYYLETLEKVFHEHQLPQGNMVIHGQKINLSSLKELRLMTVEGSIDDISAPGQTKVALDLATGIKTNQKFSLISPDTGHYGIFAGRRWREFIYPEIEKFLKNKF